jgi:hypothetical protein
MTTRWNRVWSTTIGWAVIATACVGEPGTERETDRPVTTTQSAIINGDPVASENIGLALILGASGCSGTILTPSWVLTAQHCVPFEPAGTTVTWVSAGQTRQVVQVLMHPNPGTLIDAGLMRVDPPFNIPVDATGHANRLWPGPAAALIGQTVTCSGYGYNTEDNQGFGALRTADLQVVAMELDDRYYIMVMNARGQIQAGGDSGSPCFFTSQDVRYQISVLSGAGIGSFGRQSSSVVGSVIRPWVELQLFPSCTDGQQSGTETGIDCGGSCAPCPPAARFEIISEWDTGWCGRALITNRTSALKRAWQVDFDVHQSSVYTKWNADFTNTGSLYTAKNLAWNGDIASGQTLNPDQSFGLCANKTGPNWRPEVTSAALRDF